MKGGWGAACPGKSWRRETSPWDKERGCAAGKKGGTPGGRGAIVEREKKKYAKKPFKGGNYSKNGGGNWTIPMSRIGKGTKNLIQKAQTLLQGGRKEGIKGGQKRKMAPPLTSATNCARRDQSQENVACDIGTSKTKRGGEICEEGKAKRRR